MKYFVCLITIVAFLTFFYVREVEINPKWNENLLIGLNKTEVIDFLGLPDEIDMGKDYLTWFDTRNNQVLTVGLAYLYDDYRLVQKMKISYKEQNSFKDEYFIVKSVFIKEIPLKVRYLNRDKALKNLLKYYKENKNDVHSYSYFDIIGK